MFAVSPPTAPPAILPIQDDPLTCPRERTVETLASILHAKRVVHVRGTPSSGKTTLARLLQAYYERQGEVVIFIEGWKEDIVDPMKYLLDRCEMRGYKRIEPHSLLNALVVFIIDEAQQTYRDSALWLGLIKTQSGRGVGPRICLFSSFGSPANGPTTFPVGSPLVHLGVPQRVSITVSEIPESPQISLFYNREEFDDAVARICSNPTKLMPLDMEARDYLLNITNGQPAGVNALLAYIHKVILSYTSVA
jgi:hypothetical protein